MNALNRHFSAEQRREIETVIAEAERSTGAEIVVAAAAQSGHYERPEDITGIIVATGFLAVMSYLAPHEFHFASASLALLVGYFAGVGLAMAIPPLRRLLTPRPQMLAESRRAAQALFYELEMRRAASRCGVLLYISFYERTATVIADTTALNALGQAGVDELCEHLSRELRQGKPAEAIKAIVREAGERLSVAVPRTEDDTEELPNQFLVLDN